MRSYRTKAREIAAHLRAQGLFTSISDPSIDAKKGAVLRSVGITHHEIIVGVYSDRRHIKIVGSVTLHVDGRMEVKGDEALKELVQ